MTPKRFGYTTLRYDSLSNKNDSGGLYIKIFTVVIVERVVVSWIFVSVSLLEYCNRNVVFVKEVLKFYLFFICNMFKCPTLVWGAGGVGEVENDWQRCEKGHSRQTTLAAYVNSLYPTIPQPSDNTMHRHTALALAEH